MVVGTHAAVRALTPEQVKSAGTQVVLANTYHLLARAPLIEKLGGLHDFTRWSGPILTDSGGFQVFSLEPKVDDDGATFRSTYDGSLHRLTPELAVEVQARLGAFAT